MSKRCVAFCEICFPRSVFVLSNEPMSSCSILSHDGRSVKRAVVVD